MIQNETQAREVKAMWDDEDQDRDAFVHLDDFHIPLSDIQGWRMPKQRIQREEAHVLSEAELRVLEIELEKFRINKIKENGDKLSFYDVDAWLISRGALTRLRSGEIAVVQSGDGTFSYEILSKQYRQLINWKGRREQAEKDKEKMAKIGVDNLV